VVDRVHSALDSRPSGGLDGDGSAADAETMDGGTRLPDTLTLGAFALAVTLGAGNFLAVRLSNLELAPFWGAGFRFGLAAASFIVVALALRLRWPRGRELGLTVLYGVLGFAVFYALMYWALTQVTAGVAVVVMAVVPLMTLLLATVQGLERLRIRGVLGSLLALSGIAWMTFGPQHVVVPLGALAAMLGAAVAVGQNIIVGKRLSANHPAVTNAVGMTVGAVLLLGSSAVVGEPWALPRQAEALWGVLYLVTFGSVGLFVLVLLVVRRWTASATSYMFVLFPVVTMALEAWILAEPVTGQMLVGAALVMAGVWFGALSPGARRVDTERAAHPALHAATPGRQR
jgi:drug/metabolite transporter (DMT)-like permease